ncbi:hypothetical protein TSMEX_006860 [Taenia solium]|eukprot:TsM_000409600 transcript=TsM_000409600 gene=TsM_000409600
MFLVVKRAAASTLHCRVIFRLIVSGDQVWHLARSCLVSIRTRRNCGEFGFFTAVSLSFPTWC